MSDGLTISVPKPKPACKFGEWRNEYWPSGEMKDQYFYCRATGYKSKPGAKKEKGIDVKTRCATCILYNPKEES